VKDIISIRNRFHWGEIVASMSIACTTEVMVNHRRGENHTPMHWNIGVLKDKR
jgi:cytochrome b561